MFKRRPKYGATRVTDANGTHDSKSEARRYSDLLLLCAAGKISHLERQVRFKLYGRGGNEICTYVADFVYFEDGKHVVEDWKSIRTPEFKIKQKLFEDNYPGREFRLTGAWQKIEDKKRAKARAKYQQKKMLAMMEGE